MATTSNFQFPYPGDGDTPDVPRDIKALADATDAALANALFSPALAGQKIEYGFVEAGSIGAVAAGGLYTWRVTLSSITDVKAAYATWKHISTPNVGWVAPGTVANVGRLEVNLVVAHSNTSQPLNEILVTAYFPIAFTVDNRGGEGVQWMAIGQ